MGFLESALLVVHLIVAVTLCGLVLLQHGKGADMGAAFGSGSSGSLFGASGSANFLSRTTAALAAVFFLSSLGLTYLGSMHTKSKDAVQQGIMGDVPVTKSVEVPKEVRGQRRCRRQRRPETALPPRRRRKRGRYRSNGNQLSGIRNQKMRDARSLPIWPVFLIPDS
jgi:preprotein translocase subunit SecG